MNYGYAWKEKKIFSWNICNDNLHVYRNVNGVDFAWNGKREREGGVKPFISLSTALVVCVALLIGGVVVLKKRRKVH